MPSRGSEKKPGSVEADGIESTFDTADLHVRLKPDKLFAPPPSIVETVFFSRVGHTFGPAPTSPGMPPRYVVQDFLLDQTGASGADGKMSSAKAFDLTTAISYRFNIFPKDRSKRVKVVPPTSTQVFFGIDIGRRFVNAASDVSDIYPAQCFFVDLQGPPPVFTYNSFFIGRNTNHWVRFYVTENVVGPFAFLGWTAIGTYPARSFDPGLKSYIPSSFSLPFNLPGPNSVPYVMFSYSTKSSIDPGPFVSLA